MIPHKNLNLFKKNILFLILVCLSFTSYTQETEKQTLITANVFKGTDAEKVKTRFNKNEIELKKSGLVSNVLKIINTSKDNINFTLDVLLPAQWSSIMDPEKIYNVSVNDTVIVPVLLVPSKMNTGSSEIIINAFLIDIDGEQIGDNSFILKTKKKIKWDLEVKTANRFYFKNDEFNKKFNYSIINKGNYEQDIFVNHRIPRKDMYLSDTINKEIELVNKQRNFTLDVGEEAEFSYYASAIKIDERNKKKVSTNTYTPYENKYFKKYDLIINSSEDKNTRTNIYKKNAKVSFIKLPNEINMEEYGYPSIPLTVDMYIQNVLSDYPFMSINFRGFKKLNKEASLVYSSQLNFSKNYYDGNSNQDIPWYVAYFDDQKTIEVGQITSGISGVSTYGDGIKASYRFRGQSLSAFYIGSEGFTSNSINRSYGVSHYFSIRDKIGLGTQLGRTENKIYKTNNNVITLSPYINLGRLINLNLNVSHSITEKEITAEKIKGFQYRASLTSRLFEGINTSLNGMYRDQNYNAANIQRLTASHRTYYKIDNIWSSYINNNYQRSKNPSYSSGFINEQETFFNRFMFSKKTKNGSVQTGAYYDYKNYYNTELKNRGITLRTSSFNYDKNFLTSLIFRSGYTKNLLTTDSKDIFNFDFTSLVRYRIWNFTFKYNYGNQATNSVQTIGQRNIVAQYFRFSVQNQYVLKNNRFIIQTNANYSYRNLSKNNSFGFYPELLYFSKTNWRYGLQMSYSYNSSDYSDFFESENQNSYSPNYNGKTRNSNFTIGMSIRKDFGIPIPFLKDKTSDIKFIAFQDINGNNIKDRNEEALNNIVITFGTEEVITNKNGIAKINKVPFEKYALKTLSLEELDGWFPNVSDSIIIHSKKEVQYIPFVKGVKLYGDVIMDRQKIAITDEKPLDLSRIKISATKDKSYSTLTDKEGHFEFYLPNGNYTLTMDANILSSNLRLSRNNIPVVLKNNQDGYYISFYILEKRRKVIIRDFSKKKK